MKSVETGGDCMLPIAASMSKEGMIFKTKSSMKVYHANGDVDV